VFAVAVAAFLAVVALVVVGGYGFGWTWTGLDGKTLWDWLELLLLPGSLAVFALWLSVRGATPRPWRVALGVIFAIVAVLALGSYGFGWKWTGFSGNRVWDWMNLLIVPFVLPALAAWVSIRAEVDDSEERGDHAPDLIDVRDAVSLRQGTVTVTPQPAGVVVYFDDGAGCRARPVLTPEDARQLAGALLHATGA
jgi:hypothetical protein